MNSMNEQPTEHGDRKRPTFACSAVHREETRAIPVRQAGSYSPTGRFLAADGCLASRCAARKRRA